MFLFKTKAPTVMPGLDKIKEESTKEVFKDTNKITQDVTRDLLDDLAVLERVERVSSLPTATIDNVGKFLIVNGTGAGIDNLYIGIDTGSSGYKFTNVMPKFKVSYLTRDMTAATGDVAYTGVGFQPKAIIFSGGEGGANENTYIGIDDGINHYSNYNDNGAAQYTSLSCSIACVESTGNSQVAIVKNFGVDGFTLTWTKTGSPTGSLQILYLAFG